MSQSAAPSHKWISCLHHCSAQDLTLSTYLQPLVSEHTVTQLPRVFNTQQCLCASAHMPSALALAHVAAAGSRHTCRPSCLTVPVAGSGCATWQLHPLWWQHLISWRMQRRWAPVQLVTHRLGSCLPDWAQCSARSNHCVAWLCWLASLQLVWQTKDQRWRCGAVLTGMPVACK